MHILKRDIFAIRAHSLTAAIILQSLQMTS